MTTNNDNAPPLDLDAIVARWEEANRLDSPVHVIRSWGDGPALAAEVRRLRERVDGLILRATTAEDSGARAARERDALRAENARLAPRQRAGQLVFNALAEVDSPFAESIRGTGLDPFHRDEVTAAALRAWRDNTVADARREGAEAMREACAARAQEHVAALREASGDARRDDHGAASRSYDVGAAAVGAVAAALRALPLPGGAL